MSRRYYTRELEWCTIKIDTILGIIVVQQRWQYLWRQVPPAKALTEVERLVFHQKVSAVIWDIWSKNFWAHVSGDSSFAKNFGWKKLEFFFDIRWVTANPHWTVTVTNLPKGTLLRDARVYWKKKKMFINTSDLEDRNKCRTYTKPKICLDQNILGHEFGHMIGNSYWKNENDYRVDEYRTDSPFYLDTRSIMNVGMEVRDRHFLEILNHLDTMIPDTDIWIDGPMKTGDYESYNEYKKRTGLEHLHTGNKHRN